MRIILVRHAPSMGQKDPVNYQRLGDSHVPLDPEKDYLSVECGRFLRNYFERECLKEWPLIWTSQYLRSQQTYSGILQGVRDYFSGQQPRWHIDPRLNEQSFGFLASIQSIKNPVKRFLARTFAGFSRELYLRDAFNSKTFLGEAPRETLQSVQNFLDGSFSRDVREGRKDFLIISHGAVMKAFIMNWFHLYGLDTWKELETPGNCDVYVIDGQPKNWKVRKVYDGEKTQNLLDNPVNPIENIRQPTSFPPPPLPSQG
jgi:broad specificity phosphatase PhoE